MNLCKLIFVVLGLAISTPSLAEDQAYTNESDKLLNQLRSNIKGTLLAVAESENRAGRNMANFHFSLDMPPQQMTNLGLTLNVENSTNGYQVLSVTPGSTADRLAIKSGDQVLAINDIEIDRETGEMAIQQLNKMVAGQQLKLGLNSGGSYKEVSAKISGQYMPGIRLEIGTQSSVEAATNNSDKDGDACGTVSIFFQPPASRDLYSATIHKIDSDHLKRDRNHFRLPIGKHTIYLHEQINDSMFPVRRPSINKAKPIEIDIKLNTTYHLGAKFVRKYRLNSSKGKHWEPVVWKTTERGECHF